jgi:dephospho-CoA kinase
MQSLPAGHQNENHRPGNHLLLGVTGSIATGKSTVADMLAELGAPIIDFDRLAREVVEPGMPAWKAIVDYFGESVLENNQSINRKALSNIVFNDAVKRKKLESFTHPRIQDLFIQQFEAHTKQNPNMIVQAVVPLLIEVNMQPLFHKLLVVYTPPSIQISRLMERDGISSAQARKILDSQISIDEKVKHADYVIHNDKSLDDTRSQVKDLWKALQRDLEKMQRDGDL